MARVSRLALVLFRRLFQRTVCGSLRGEWACTPLQKADSSGLRI